MRRPVPSGRVPADHVADLPRAPLAPFRAAWLARLPEERRVGLAVSALPGQLDLPD